VKFQNSRAGKRYVGPTYGFVASPEVDPGGTVGTLQTGYPVCKLQVKTSSRACMHMLQCVPHLRTSPPCQGGLLCCLVSCGPKPRLLDEVSSDGATCPSAPNLASLSRLALVLPRAPWLWALPPREGSSSAATCRMTPSRLWTTGIRKGLATLSTQLGLRVSMGRTCLPKVHMPNKCYCRH
jgi:hypothetical protein